MPLPGLQGDFKLTFASQPFALDAAKVVRASPIRPAATGSEGGPDFVRKQQPVMDLIDQVNLLLPFHYLQDYLPPDRRLPQTLVPLDPAPSPSRNRPDVRVGEWFYPAGAARWSVFRGLAAATDVAKMLEETQGGRPADFVMQSAPVGLGPDQYLLETEMYLLPPRPLAEHGSAFDGLYLVTLVDERYWWQYKPVSLLGYQGHSWSDQIDRIAETLGISTIAYDPIPEVYSTPEYDSALWTNWENAAVLLDAIAANIGRVVVRDLDGSYRLYDAQDSRIIAGMNRGPVARVQRTAGGDLFNGPGDDLVFTSGTILSGMEVSGTVTIGQPALGLDLSRARNAAVPAAVTVTFPRYILGDDPVPHFHNPRYGSPEPSPRPSAWFEDSFGDVYPVRVPIESGLANLFTGTSSGRVSGVTGTGQPPVVIAVSGTPTPSASGGFTHTIHTLAKALYNAELDITSGLAPVNASSLTVLAVQLATDYYDWQLLAALDEVYPGTLKWRPEGIHDILWTYSARARGARTRVFRSPWNRFGSRFQHATPPASTVVSGTFSSGQIFGSGPGATSGSIISGFVVTSGDLFSGTVLSGRTSTVRGVGGRAVAQTWIDSFGASGTFLGPSGFSITSGTYNSGDIFGSGGGIGGVSGAISGTNTSGFVITSGTYGSGSFYGTVPPRDCLIETTLIETLLSGDHTAVVKSVDYLPTQNRWRGRIRDEVVLFEGTSGGISGNSIDIVFRGIDGTLIPEEHPNQSRVCYMTPNTTYGVNLVTFEKMQFAFPQHWTSGGIQSVAVVPQVQTVQVLDGSGIFMGGTIHYSGAVHTYDPTREAPWLRSDAVWVIDRNAARATSGLLRSGFLSGGVVGSGCVSGFQGMSGGPCSGWLSGVNPSGIIFSGEVTGRAGNPPTSGCLYAGQLVGFSRSVSGSEGFPGSLDFPFKEFRGNPAPVYAIDPGSVGSAEGRLVRLTAKEVSTGHFTLYSWKAVADKDSPVPIQFQDLSETGSPGNNPAYHKDNIDIPVPSIVRIRKGMGNYYLIDQMPRWEFVRKTALPVSGIVVSGTTSGQTVSGNPISGTSYFFGRLVRYDQGGKFFRNTDERVFIIEANSLSGIA